MKGKVTGWLHKVRKAVGAAAAPEKVQLDLETLNQLARDAAPVIWMLGKTGAGKTSIVSTMTGITHAAIGNGYVPCTKTANLFDFPQEMPLIRFLDTRGLGEPGYDAAQDLAWHQNAAHLVMVVMKVCAPEQDEVLGALQRIRKEKPKWPILVVQTGLHDLYPDDAPEHPADYPFRGTEADMHNPAIPRALRNALQYQRDLFSKIKGKRPRFVAVDFTQAVDGYTPTDYGKAALEEAVLKIAPSALKRLVQLRLQQQQSSVSSKLLSELNSKILYWAAGAAAVGTAPVVGLVTVPVAQGIMLNQLAKSYGLTWGKKDFAALGGMLGLAIVANQGALLGLRQLAKIGPWFIPLAAAQDYAVTYALGRAACVYLQSRQDQTEVNADLVKAAFHDGLKQAFAASEARRRR